MKREYVSPSLQWVAMRSSDAVADICWAYARNGKDFYHDIPGMGYAILKIVSSGGCKADVVFVVEFSSGEQMTASQMAAAQSYIDKVIADAKAKAGNKASNYKGSVFVASPDYSWS